MNKTNRKYLFQLILEIVICIALSGWIVYDMIQENDLNIMSIILIVALIVITAIRSQTHYKQYKGEIVETKKK